MPGACCYSTIMRRPAPFTKRKRQTGSSGAAESKVYPLLCIVAIGFFAWIWWHSNHEPGNQPSPQPPTVAERRSKAVQLSFKQPVYIAPKVFVTNHIAMVMNHIASVTNHIAMVTNHIASVTNHVSTATFSTNLVQPAILLKVPTNSVVALELTNRVTTSAPIIPHQAPLIVTPIAPPPQATTSPQPPAPTRVGPLRPPTLLEVQIALARQGISSGSMDGGLGPQTRSALAAFQRKELLPITGTFDTNTRAHLEITPPTLGPYVISSNDLQRLLPVATNWVGKSEQPRMDYETILELLGEKSFSHPHLIRDLNPGVNWNRVTAGTTVKLPQVEYPPVVNKAALVRISLKDRVLEAFDGDTNLLVHFPCSIGKLAQKRPVGELHVIAISVHPNYTFNPEVFPESEEAQRVGHKLVIPPGPNNPVGVAWIGLDRPGYGIHGTPGPEQVGRTESHGCFRLANWNAEYLARLVWVGMPVVVDQ